MRPLRDRSRQPEHIDVTFSLRIEAERLLLLFKQLSELKQHGPPLSLQLGQIRSRNAFSNLMGRLLTEADLV
jgi:hypothetical protein